MRASWGFYLVTLIGIFAWGVLVTNVLPDAWLKLDFYGGSAINHVYTTGLELVTSCIYLEETCHDQQWQRARTAQGHVPRHRRHWRCRSSPKVVISTLLARVCR